MKYKFEIINVYDERDMVNKNIPVLNIENPEQYGDFFIDEISNLTLEYLGEIINELKKLVKGEVEVYEFGYEVYNIECKKEESRVLNTFEDWREEAIVSTLELYELLKNWRKFILENQS